MFTQPPIKMYQKNELISCREFKNEVVEKLAKFEADAKLYSDAIQHLQDKIDGLELVSVPLRRAIAANADATAGARRAADIKSAQAQPANLLGDIKAGITAHLKVKAIQDILDDLGGDIRDEIQNHFFNNTLDELNRENEVEYQTKIRKMKRAKYGLEHLLKVAEHNIFVKKAQQQEMNQFLKDFQSRPRALCNSFKKTVAGLVSDYENKYLFEQTERVQIVLAELTETVALILAEREPGSEGANIEYYQHKLLELNGLLWALYRYFEKTTTKEEMELRDKIFELLQVMHMNSDDTLKQDHISPSKLYKANYFDQGTVITEDSYAAGVSNRYADAKKEFEGVVAQYKNTDPAIYAASHSLLKNIDVESQHPHRIKFCINTLKATTVRLCNKVPDASEDDFIARANRSPGAPSWARKILGGAICLLGLVAMAAAVYGFIQTAGGSSIVSFGALKLGWALWGYGVAYVAGFTVGGLGEALGVSGMRRGISGDMVNIHTASENSPTKKPELPRPSGVPATLYSVAKASESVRVGADVKVDLRPVASAPPAYSPA